MSLAVLIFLLAVVVVCAAAILFGVYVDHVRRRRRQTSAELRRILDDHSQLRSESLEVIGGSYRDQAPEPHLGKPRLP